MKRIVLIISFMYLTLAGFSQTSFTATNPNNSSASVSLNWLQDIARIRVGGSGVGATNGFDIQTTGDRSLMRLTHSGNIGIGADSPATQLVVGSNFGANISGSGGGKGIFGSNLAVYNGGPNHNGLYTPSTHTNGYGYAGIQASWGKISFYTNSGNTTSGQVVSPTTRMTILENGNVGINTHTPSEELHVKGRIFLEGTEATGTGWKENYLMYRGHSLIIGSPVGIGRNNAVDIKPGGRAGVPLNSMLQLFHVPDENQHELKVRIHSGGHSYFNGGNVGIGTSTPDSKLTVNGDIHAEEVKVDLSVPGPDYVFEEDYHLISLESIRQYVKENKHLPEVPSASEMEENGIDLGLMNMLLLKKVEELTLYQIQLLEKLESQDAQLFILKREIQELRCDNH